MLNIAENRPSKIALYHQVYEILRRRIEDQTLPDGSYLPNEYDLSKSLDVSIGTIRKAIDLLCEARLVIRYQGKGTVVSDRRWTDLQDRLSRFRRYDNNKAPAWNNLELVHRTELGDEEIAKALQIQIAEPVIHIHRLRSTDTEAMVEEDIFLPTQFSFAAFETKPERYSFIQYCKSINRSVGNVEEKMFTEHFLHRELQWLRYDDQERLLVFYRTIYDTNNEVLEYRRSHCILRGLYYSLSI